MHGREQREGENHRRIVIPSSDCSQHMRSVPSNSTKTILADADSSLVSTTITTFTSADYFCKDGRKISVGDCALFKPAQDSPPFIGLIRRLTLSKENHLLLGVNWLYRPAEVKLGKGILLDAAPNELFYSFHKDEVAAAALLHPCKVAFLPKGAELPTGISSFVCQRVYDIDNKCLWWLTDQDYIDERQEEVDKLLKKTQVEMDATLQPGGRSPKPTSNLISTSQLKPGSDGLQNSVTSIPSQTKGKKRERGDQSSDPIKRERSLKTDDSDSSLVKSENYLKSEIAKITERGGLVDSESVEKLVQLIQPDRMDKKMDLISRSMLAGVIAATPTDKKDYLTRFVELKGLPVLDEWLQDVNKGRIGDGSGSKDGDKSSEEFLLVLLRALDKLPVNLNALQTSNIGRSVNHLRTHKNLEIQRKARSLVDTWKKRVEAEMNVLDAKSGSTQAATWPKSRLPDGHVGRNSTGSGDVALKSSVTQLSASKTVSVKVSNVEAATKSASLSPGPIKSASSPASGKEDQPRTTAGCATDVPLSTREDKSSSSSQSHNYSQSFSGKEDARSSTAVSMSISKISGGGSRHRKSINGYPGASVSGSPKETGTGRNLSVHRNVAQDKFSQSASTGEKVFDVPVEGSSHKLIVKLNRGRSPAQSVSGGSFEDPSIMSSRASSPVLSDRHEQSDRSTKEKCDAYRANIPSEVNAESWQSNDFKDLQAGSEEGDGSPATLPDEERTKTVEGKKAPEVSKAASSSSGNDLKSGKLHEASFSSMNALIESCAKYSEANASMSPVDEVGMNLLASVAAGEMCKSQLVSPTDSPQGSTPAVEETCLGDDAKSKPPPGDNFAREQCLASDAVDGVDEKQAVPPIGSWSKDGSHHVGSSQMEVSGDRKPDSFLSGETREATMDHNSEMNEKSDEFKGSSSFSPTPKVPMERDGQSNQLHEEKAVSNSSREDAVPDSKLGEGFLLSEVVVSNVVSHTQDAKQKVEIPSAENECKKDVNERSNTGGQGEQKATSIVQQTNVSSKDLAAEDTDEIKAGEAAENRGNNCLILSEGHKLDRESNCSLAANDQCLDVSGSAVTEQRKDYVKACAQGKEVLEPRSSGSFPQTESLSFPSRDADGDAELKGSKISDVEVDKRVEYKPTVADDASLSAAETTEMDSKVNFDLNEGLGDDGKYGEPMNLVSSGSLSSVHVVNPLSSIISSGSGSIPASITVAAAAKGAFVPPVDLLRSKGELGWKGSAATSAFRPAEPRKVLQLPVGPINSSVDDSSSKPCRPPLDIDLNVPDERLLEDMGCRDSTIEIGSNSDHLNNHVKSKNEFASPAPGRSSGGLDLDLNRVDDSNDMMQYPVSSTRRLDANIVPVKSLSSSALPSNEVRRDFDLNGPGVDDASAEQSSFNHQGRGSTLSVHAQLPVAGIRPNSLESGNFSAWFPSGNSYSSVTIPSVLPDRGEQQPFPIIAPGAPQRILGPPGGNPFSPDIYRGSVLSSSPAVPFASSPFPYQMFPFGTTLPLPSATFSVGSTSYMDSASGGRLFNPPVNPQYLGPVGAVSSQYPRPFMVSLPDGSNNGGMEHNRKWNRQGLDLNAGPGGLDGETREETLAQRQLSVASSQALAEEQARMYPVAGGVLKRKEPDGGWENESFRYKQSSWQ